MISARSKVKGHLQLYHAYITPSEEEENGPPYVQTDEVHNF